jgi:hypothetical protein
MGMPLTGFAVIELPPEAMSRHFKWPDYQPDREPQRDNLRAVSLFSVPELTRGFAI